MATRRFKLLHQREKQVISLPKEENLHKPLRERGDARELALKLEPKEIKAVNPRTLEAPITLRIMEEKEEKEDGRRSRRNCREKERKRMKI